MGGQVDAIWTSGHYRYENDDGTVDASTFITTEDTAVTQDADSNFRLRINWGESAAQTKGDSLTPALQFNINSGSWITVGAATAVKFATSSDATDGDTGTERLTTAPTGVASYVQTYFDDNNVLAAEAPIDEYYEIAFNLQIDSAQVSDADTINFQLIDGAAAAIFTVTDTTPTLTVNIAAANITGTLDYTNLDDTITGAGSVTDEGTLDYTELADTIVANGSAENTGTVVETNDDDTIVSSGNVTDVGVLDYIEELDTATTSGVVIDLGSLDYVEEDDAVIATGSAGEDVTGTLVETELNDTVVATGISSDPLLLDTLAGSIDGAFSLSRYLALTFIGSAVARLREDNTDTEIDFKLNGADVLVTDDVNEYTVATWLTNNSATNAYIVTWYDQSGNGRNYSQATAATQPVLDESGFGGKTCGEYTAARNAHLTSDSSYEMVENAGSYVGMAVQFATNTASSPQALFSDPFSTTWFVGAGIDIANWGFQVSFSDGFVENGSVTLHQKYILTSEFTAVAAPQACSMRINGAEIINGLYSIDAREGTHYIGGYASGGRYVDFLVAELIFTNEALSAIDRDLIEADQGVQYDITFGVTGTLDYSEVDDLITSNGIIEVIGGATETSDDDTTTANGLLKNTGQLDYSEENDLVVSAGSIIDIGVLDYTNSNDSVTASGNITLSGSLNETEADDTIIAAGNVVVSEDVTGTLNYTNENDSIAAQGILTVSGSLSETNADDLTTTSGVISVIGSLSETELNDTVVANGTAIQNITGSLSETNDDDSIVSNGIITNKGSLDSTELNDTLEAVGIQGESVAGTLVETELNDTLTSVGNPKQLGTLSETLDDDTVVAAGKSGLQGSLNTTEEDDTLLTSGGITINGTLVSIISDDVLNSSGVLITEGTISETEDDDSSTTSGFITNKGYILEVTEDDTLAATGFVIQAVTGILNSISGDGTLVASGTVQIKFDIDILSLNLTIPKADEDPAEQQRILIENFILIQQALRNLGQ